MATTSSVSGIAQDQFLQLLVTQLQNQDPLDPMDSSDFIGQLTALNTLQGIQTLNASFSEILKLQQLTEGVNLLGKTVDYAPSGGGANITGKVEFVVVQDGKFVLKIGDTQVGLDQIVTVRS